jgi:hypothetical protein
MTFALILDREDQEAGVLPALRVTGALIPDRKITKRASCPHFL